MSNNKKKIAFFWKITSIVIGTIFIMLGVIVKKKKKDSVYGNEPEQKNPMEGKRVIFVEDEKEKKNADGRHGHLEAAADLEYHLSFYGKYTKRAIDIVLSFVGLIVLSPVFLGLIIAIKIDDPGPSIFIQKYLVSNTL